MKKFLIVTLLVAFSTSVYASSCPMMANKIDNKIEQVQKLRDDAMKAHEAGDHAKADELLEKAMNLFKG